MTALLFSPLVFTLILFNAKINATHFSALKINNSKVCHKRKCVTLVYSRGCGLKITDPQEAVSC